MTLALVFAMWLMPKHISAQNTTVSFQVFYDELSPYGTWINDPNYGYVWAPNAVSTFAPYSTNGYWIYTDYGWTWVSNYAWGWAPFHYGRWNYEPAYGWIWIPDTEWGPAWVYWRDSPDYYGWAPMAYGYNDMNNAYYNNYNCWRFVRAHDFGRRNIYNYYILRNNYPTIYAKTSYIQQGPNVIEVRKISGRTIQTIPIGYYNKPGHYYANNKLYIYRPQVQKALNNQRPAPSKTIDPANYGGYKKSTGTAGQSPNPANYGGRKPLLQKQPSNQNTSPNPANYGGVNNQQNQPANRNKKSSPNPANYGGKKPLQQAQPTNRVQQQAPNPANYGGQRPLQQNRPIQQPSSNPNPANYGGVKPLQRAPAPMPQTHPTLPQQHRQLPQPQQKPNPSNFGGRR
jgi:hypothetical protein